MNLSKKAQKLWDDFGVAYESHFDASSYGTTEESTAAAGAYLKASRKLHNYLATLERKAAASVK